MAVKSNFASGNVLTASDVNTYLTNGGLVYITETSASGSATTLSINNCFSASYNNYRILIDYFQPATAARTVFMRLRSGGTDATGADYYFALAGYFTTAAAVSDFNLAGTTSMTTGLYNSGNTLGLGAASIDLYAPFKTERTYGLVHSAGYDSNFFYRTGIIEHNLTNSYDGFTLLLSGTGNITNLRVKVYGYRQA